MAPGFLVGIGSILHTIKGKTSGFVLLIVGSIFLGLMALGYVFGGVIFYLFGLWGGIVILTQAVIAIITVILALLEPSTRTS